VNDLLQHIERVRERTRRVAALIPPDKLEWTHRPGAMTLGDLVRHIAVTERDMWAENVSGRRSRYKTHGPELAATLDEVIALLDRNHAESMAIFKALTPEQWTEPCETPGGAKLPVWKWVRAMVEHEIHHRGQLYLMLSMIGVQTPPIFGLTSEQVRQKA